MTRNARTEAKRPTLCHAGERAAGAPVRAGAAAGAASKTTGPSNPTPADNFCARVRSNRESRAAAGARFEAHALAFLQRQRLVLVARNVHCRGGELDLVMRERDGTLVFVEVRARTRRGYGGAAASVGWHKRQRVLRAARYFLAARAGGDPDAFAAPACRFDVVAFEAGRLEWLRDAFREDES